MAMGSTGAPQNTTGVWGNPGGLSGAVPPAKPLAPTYGRFFDPATGAWHVWTPGVTVPSGQKIIYGTPKVVKTFIDQNAITHTVVPGMTVPPGTKIRTGVQQVAIPGGQNVVTKPPPPFTGAPPGLSGPSGTKTPTTKSGPPAGPKGPTAKAAPTVKQKSPAKTPPNQNPNNNPPNPDPNAVGAPAFDNTALVNAINSLFGINTNIPYGALNQLATDQASKIVNQTVQGYRDTQSQISQQGRTAAEALQAAGNVLAKMQAGSGAATQNAYDNAGKALSAIASGFTAPMAAGGAAEQQANAAQASALGLPVAPTINPQAAALAINSQYGTLPGSSLAAQGLALRTAMQPGGPGTKLPGVAGLFLGQGTQQSQLALGAANQAANAINPQIQQAYQQLPSLTQTALSNLVSQSQAGIDERVKLAVAKAAALQNVGQLGVSQAKVTQAGQIANQKAIEASVADGIRKLSANAATIQARAAVIRANNSGISNAASLTRAKAALQKEQTADASAVSKAIQDSVYGVSKIVNSGGTPTSVVTQPSVPLATAFRNILRAHPAYRTAAGQAVVIGWLRDAYRAPAAAAGINIDQFSDADLINGVGPGNHAGAGNAIVGSPQPFPIDPIGATAIGTPTVTAGGYGGIPGLNG